MTLERHENQ